MGNIPGSADCQAHIGAWGQPALLGTSLAYLAAAAFVLWWAARHHSPHHPVPPGQIRTYAAGLALAGLGSIDYHGPAVGPQPLLHDAGPAVVLVAALSVDLTQLGVRRTHRIRFLAFLLVSALLVIAAFPDLAPLLAAVAAAWLAADVVVYRRGIRAPSPALFAALACLVTGGLVFPLSRTGGPWCDPDSWLQGHGFWHVMTALALGLWAVTAEPRAGPSPQG